MKGVRLFVSVVLLLHGMIHLLGALSYLRLAGVQGLPYKTTVLEGRIDLGAVGTGVFGAGWAVAAVVFVVAAWACWVRRVWWRNVLIAVTGLSLVLTVLDFDVALAGIVVNVALLLALWGVPRWSAQQFVAGGR